MISVIKNHSFTICRENARRTQNASYPEDYIKIETTFSTISSTLERSFIEYEEVSEMTAISKFCRRIFPVLKLNRPAVGISEYLHLIIISLIFGDESFESCVQTIDHSEALTKFIDAISKHIELINFVPSGISSIYQHLKSSFTFSHTIQISEFPEEMQHASNLANIFSGDILEHLPDCNDEELSIIVAKLGIFAKSSAYFVNDECGIIESEDCIVEPDCCYECSSNITSNSIFSKSCSINRNIKRKKHLLCLGDKEEISNSTAAGNQCLFDDDDTPFAKSVAKEISSLFVNEEIPQNSRSTAESPSLFDVKDQFEREEIQNQEKEILNSDEENEIDEEHEIENDVDVLEIWN